MIFKKILIEGKTGRKKERKKHINLYIIQWVVVVAWLVGSYSGIPTDIHIYIYIYIHPSSSLNISARAGIIILNDQEERRKKKEERRRMN